MRRIVRVLGIVGAAVVLVGCPNYWLAPDHNPDRTSYNELEDQLTVANIGQLRRKWTWTEHVGEKTWGTVTQPIVSQAGVHFAKGCFLATLEEGSGTVRWTSPAKPWTICPETGSNFMFPSDPHVVDTAEGHRVIWSRVRQRPGTGNTFSWEWFTSLNDAQSGTRLGTPPFDYVAGLRGADVLGVSAVRNQFQTDLNILSIGAVDGTARRFYTSATNEFRGLVTAGSGLIFQTGPGALTTTAGPSTQGLGVRAYSRSESRPGCTIQVEQPAFAHDVECPVWVNPLGPLPGGTQLTAPVLGPDGTAVYVVGAGTLYALDAATGATLWTAAGAGGQPALANGMLFVPTDDGQVVTFPATGCGAPTCTPVTRFDTQTGGDTSDPVVAGELVYVTVGGTLYTFHKIGCPNNWCAPLSSLATGAAAVSAPVVANGQVYLTTTNSLMAFGPPS